VSSADENFASAYRYGFVTLARKKLLDGLMDPRGDDAGAHHLNGLCPCTVSYADRLAGATLDHRRVMSPR
jgi:hypothetical protein